jgi:hypothetical protein
MGVVGNVRVRTYTKGGAGLLMTPGSGIQIRAAQGNLTVTFRDGSPLTPLTATAPKGQFTEPFFVIAGAAPGIYELNVTIQINSPAKTRSHYIVVVPSPQPDPDIVNPGEIVALDVCVDPSRPQECDI